MIIAGVVWTLLVAAITGVLVRLAAKRLARRVKRDLLEQIGAEVDQRLLEPLRGELERQEEILTTLRGELAG